LRTARNKRIDVYGAVHPILALNWFLQRDEMWKHFAHMTVADWMLQKFLRAWRPQLN
jgi:hypothetical protein